MPILTRRRVPDAPSEAWRVFCGDVPVGTIGRRSGVPVDVEQLGLVLRLPSRHEAFAGLEAAERWFAEPDPEGVAFEYPVVD
jgi:hypothetical protein